MLQQFWELKTLTSEVYSTVTFQHGNHAFPTKDDTFWLKDQYIWTAQPIVKGLAQSPQTERSYTLRPCSDHKKIYSENLLRPTTIILLCKNLENEFPNQLSFPVLSRETLSFRQVLP